jgi:GntR family phosphonate transport system transcriptional regulator
MLEASVTNAAAPAGSAPLARGQGVALWRQIAGTLEKEIAGGGLQPGARLPTEADLTARFAVNRHTVRRAMEELQSRGLVRIEQGRGSFVAEDVLDYPLGPRTRFSETIRRQNREPQGRILRLEEIDADGMVAEALKLRRGRPVVIAERLGLVDSRPVLVGAHYFSAARFPGIARLLAEDASITRALATLGVADYRRQTTRITARMPTVEEAALLEQSRTRPVLVTEAVNVDPAGEPIELSIACYAAGRMQILVES